LNNLTYDSYPIRKRAIRGLGYSARSHGY